MARSNGYSKLIETMVSSQRDIQTALTAQGQSLATANQKLADLHDRLLGPEGAIPRIGIKIKKMEEENEIAIKGLAEKHIKLSTKVTWYVGVGTGVAITISAFSKAVAAKFGIHF